MKISTFLAIAATIVAAALFAACGGDDSTTSNVNGNTSGNQTSQIKTQHGLAVAQLAADFRQTSDTSSQDAAALPASESSQNGPASAASAANSAKTLGDTTSSINGAPQAASDGAGITGQGYGLASADADSAVVQVYFSSYNYGSPVPIYAPDASGSAPIKPDIASPGPVGPITEADLQPVITALTNAGVAAADIEFVGQSYYDSYSASATLQATIKTLANVDSAVQAAQTAAGNLGAITLQSTNVSYTLQDCAALEKAAMEAAVGDAGERGALLAGALHVGLGSVTGASDYSYSPSGVPCTSTYYGYPMYYGVAYDSIRANGGSTSNTVQVVAQISVTYAMK